jgi:hypothetical protein
MKKLFSKSKDSLDKKNIQEYFKDTLKKSKVTFNLILDYDDVMIFKTIYEDNTLNKIFLLILIKS